MAKRGKFEQPRVEPVEVILKRPRRNPLVWIIPAALAVIAVLVVTLVGVSLKNGHTIYPNVRVAGVDVGGLTAAEARELVEQTVEEAYRAQTLEVRLPDKTLYFDSEKANVTVDAEQTIQKAMTYGRDKGVFWALLRYLMSSKSVHTVSMEAAMSMNTDYLQSTIQKAADEARIDPINTTVSMDAEMTKMTVRLGTSGQKLDTDDLYHAVYQAFIRGDLDPLTWEYERVPHGTVDMVEVQERLAAPAKDAYYDAEKHQIIPGTTGHTFDRPALMERAKEYSEGEAIEVPLEILEPQVTTGKLTYQMFGEILEQRSSVYVNNPDRTENLRLACEAINGTIINPGEVFSFNDAVGERTEERGFRPATIYGGEGESVDGVGGGVCQVASTIYYAALYMDLPTVMREPHMYEVTYVPAGCDATVFWDSGLDYKFRNDRENPIKIQANIDGGKVNITFWGVKESDNYVELSKPVTLETWNDEDVEEVDETKPVGYREQKQTAYTGSKVVVTKKVFDGSGKLLREEKLESTYKSRPNIYIVGPSEEVPPTEEWPAEDPGITENPWESTTENTEGTLWTEEGM